MWCQSFYHETNIQTLGQSWTRATKLRLPKHTDTVRCIYDPVSGSRKRVGLFTDKTNLGEG